MVPEKRRVRHRFVSRSRHLSDCFKILFPFRLSRKVSAGKGRKTPVLHPDFETAVGGTHPDAGPRARSADSDRPLTFSPDWRRDAPGAFHRPRCPIRYPTTYDGADEQGSAMCSCLERQPVCFRLTPEAERSPGFRFVLNSGSPVAAADRCPSRAFSRVPVRGARSAPVMAMHESDRSSVVNR